MQVSDQGAMQVMHRLAAEFASAALVGLAGIGEAVAENDLSGCQRRENDFVGVLGAGGEHERQFRHGSEAGGARIEQQAPDFFSGDGASGFAGHRYWDVLFLQNDGEALHLRALTAAVQAFEGDEFSAPRTHVGNHTGGVWRDEAATPLLYSIVWIGGFMRVSHFAVVLIVVVSMMSVSLLAAPAAPHITIALDATDAPRKILHAQLTIPAAPGTLTLYYPKWIPGEHAPSGPVIDLAGLKFTGNGQLLKWRRALDDNWTVNVEVPAGVQEVHASLDFLFPVSGDEALFSAGASATEKLALISWNQVLLYPKGWTADQLTYSASDTTSRGMEIRHTFAGGFAVGRRNSVQPGFALHAGGFARYYRRVSENCSAQSGADSSR